MKNDTQTDASASPWTITLRGNPYALVPSTGALIALEQELGSSVLSIVESGSNGGLSITHMRAIAAALVDGIPEDDAVFGRARQAIRGQLLGAPAHGLDQIAEAIVEAGTMAVLPRLLLPLMAVMAGKVDAAGNLTAEKVA